MIGQFWARVRAWFAPPPAPPPPPTPFVDEMQDYYGYGINQKWASLRARSEDRQRRRRMRSNPIADDIFGRPPPERIPSPHRGEMEGGRR